MQKVKENILNTVVLPIFVTLIIIAPFAVAIMCSNIKRSDDISRYIIDSLSISYKISDVNYVDTVYNYEKFKTDSILYELQLFQYNSKIYSLTAFINNADKRIADNHEFIIESVSYDLAQTKQQLEKCKEKMNRYISEHNQYDSTYYGFVYKVSFDNDSVIYIMKNHSIYQVYPIKTDMSYLRWLKK